MQSNLKFNIQILKLTLLRRCQKWSLGSSSITSIVAAFRVLLGTCLAVLNPGHGYADSSQWSCFQKRLHAQSRSEIVCEYSDMLLFEIADPDYKRNLLQCKERNQVVFPQSLPYYTVFKKKSQNILNTHLISIVYLK